MKKLFYLIGSLVIIAGATSCKKSWTCQCTTTDNYGGQISTQTTEIELTTYHKGVAESTCSANTASTSSAGYTSSTSCHLK